MKLVRKIPFWLRMSIMPVILYVSWICTGMVLIESKVARTYPVGFNTVITDGSLAQDTSQASWDGPHIFYRGEATIIKQVLMRKDKVYPSLDTLFGSIKGKQITCHVNDMVKFRTNIKKSLKNEPCIYPKPSKLLAVSDIEGEFLIFREFLINNGVMSKEYKWTFGDGHLVLNGDFFDRGLHVTECLWLIYHLEQEAAKQGGKVHFILGNHEIMNMNNDLRYVRNKYYENTYIIKEAYVNWYSPDSELGRWLQTKNIVEQIGDYLFTHGGISEKVASEKDDITKINSMARDFYFREDKAREGKNDLLALLFDSENSPFWYRGYVNQSLSQEAVDAILAKYNVSKIVVGHSLVDDVRYLYDGKIIAIDTKHSAGDSEGMLVENEKEYRVDINGDRMGIQ